MDCAKLVASNPAAMHTMPAMHTSRGPKRSANMPPPMPSVKYKRPDKPNTNAMSARCAANSPAKDSNSAANEYAVPKITARQVNAAQTTTQA